MCCPALRVWWRHQPLTTLVQAGGGRLTEAVARENVALQLAIAAAKVDAYQDDPATTTTNCQTPLARQPWWWKRCWRTVPLVVGDQRPLAGLQHAGQPELRQRQRFYLQTLTVALKRLARLARKPPTPAAARSLESRVQTVEVRTLCTGLLTSERMAGTTAPAALPFKAPQATPVGRSVAGFARQWVSPLAPAWLIRQCRIW